MIIETGAHKDWNTGQTRITIQSKQEPKLNKFQKINFSVTSQKPQDCNTNQIYFSGTQIEKASDVFWNKIN